jgi:hypothetical protein
MKQSIKKYPKILVLITLMIALALPAQVCATDLAGQDKALSFATDVMQLDLTKYTVTPSGYYVDYPDELNGAPQEKVKLNLTSQNSLLMLSYDFSNKSLTYFTLRVIEGSALYTQSSNDLVDWATDFLGRYQQWNTNSSLTEMSNLLKSVNATENATKTAGNLKLTVEVTEQYTSFRWKYVYNDAEYNGLIMTFQGKNFFFKDDRSLFKIGKTDVNISEEEAISITLGNIENYSYKLVNGSEIKDFDISKANVTAAIFTRTRDPSSTLYPYWAVEVTLDHSYPGDIYAISVALWADTGETFLITPLGVGGIYPPEGSTIQPEPSTTESVQAQTENNTSPPTNVPILVAVLVTIALVAITAVAITLKKRSK